MAMRDFVSSFVTEKSSRHNLGKARTWIIRADKVLSLWSTYKISILIQENTIKNLFYFVISGTKNPQIIHKIYNFLIYFGVPGHSATSLSPARSLSQSRALSWTLDSWLVICILHSCYRRRHRSLFLGNSNIIEAFGNRFKPLKLLVLLSYLYGGLPRAREMSMRKEMNDVGKPLIILY